MTANTKSNSWVDPKGQFALNGWIVVPAAEANSAEILIKIDDLDPIAVRTKIHQKNFDFEGKDSTRLKFTAIYPPRLYDGKAHAVELIDAASGEVVHGATKTFQDLNLTGKSGRDFIGGVTFIAKAGHIEGWVFDKERPERPVTVDLIVDGRRVARDLANLTTPNMVGSTGERHGFRIQVPNAFVDGSEHSFEVLVDGEPLPAIDGAFSIDIQDQAHQIAGIPMFYARFDSVGFEYLRGMVKTETRNFASLSLCVGDTVVLKTPIEQSLHEGLVDIRLKIPDKIYDGKKKALSVRVDTPRGQKTIWSATRIMPPKLVDQARVFGLAVRDGRLSGKVLIENEWALEGGVGLFVGDVRVGVCELSPQSGDWGEPVDFNFDLDALSALPWLKMGVEVALLQSGARRFDVLPALLEAAVVSITAATLSIETPVPLTGLVRVGVARPNGRDRSVDVECVRSVSIVQPLSRAEAAEAKQLTISLDDRIVSAGGTVSPQRETAPQVIVSSTIDPEHPAVRAAMEAARFGGFSKPDEARKGEAAGVWELVSPQRIAGWAIDLEDPTRVLSVSLRVDGKDFGPYAANMTERISPDLAVDRGFEIDIDRIDVDPGLKTFEVRFAGSETRLHPPVAAQLVFPGRSLTSNVIDEIDQLVESGRFDEARSVSKAALGSDPAVAVRFFVLDAMSRRDWTGHAQRVDRLGDALEPDQRAPIKRLKPIVESRDVSALKGALGALNLRQSYAAALSQRVLELRAEPSEDFSDAYAQWIATTQFRPAATNAHAPARRIVVVDLTGAEQATAPASTGGPDRRLLSAAACEALRESGASSSAVDELRAATQDADWTLLIGRPRFAPQDAETLWPNLTAAYGACDTTVISGDAKPGSSPARELDRWSAFVPTGSFDQLVAAARAVVRGEARSLGINDGGSKRGEIVLLRAAPADAVDAATVGFVCLHDFPSDQPTPAVPPGMRVARGEWALQGGLPTPAQIAEALPSEAGEWDGGIIVLSNRIRYPNDYLFDCMRHFERSPGGVAFHGLGYDRLKARFVYDAYDRFDETSAALLPLGCFPASLLASGQAAGSFGELRIVQGQKPFQVVRLDEFLTNEEKQEIFSEFAAGCSPSEHEAGFTSALRERHHTAFWRFQNLLAPLKLPGIDDDLRSLAGTLGLRSLLERIERGQITEAQHGLRLFIERQDFLAPASAPVLQLVLILVRLTGQQNELMASLLPNMPKLVGLHPTLIIELFENAAFALEPAELAATVLSCVQSALENKRNFPIARLLEVARRYCGEKIMILLLSLIDMSDRRGILFEGDIQRTIGSVFTAGESPTFQLANTRLTQKDFGAAAPKEVRLITSLLEGRRSDFLQVLNDLILESNDLLAVARLLRTYTNELKQFQIRGREVNYPSFRGVDEALQLALILGDIETASSHMADEPAGVAQTQPDSLQIVWNSVQHNYGPLNEALRVWYAPYDLEPVTLAGADMLSIFASPFEGHSLPKAETRGRVSIVCTVFNPDIDLLKVSIESMLAQTHDDIEIILVDDASDPEFAEGIAEASKRDPRIRYLRTSRNAGPYFGRNLALEIATGEFIAIQDGDDIAHPQRLEFQVRTLTEEPAYKMATSGHLRIDTGGQVQFEHTLDLIGDGTMTSIFRRSLFDQIGGFASVRSRGDVEFRERVRRAFGSHVISHTEIPLLFCLASPGSLSNQTAARYGSYLALYRDGFAKRIVRSFIESEPCGSADAPLVVPYPLRPTTPR
ncbi:MAG: hypothetical protein DI565_12210 [Ancylobacter novellus]|uniref:Glycosyltransferase 2-like domain-containing protein n=1 Tax=Ancylobacter novellus TaxID=921 RepID=A0A2W5KBG2_ANCNO|nr:MAG: hypothetical protein DI565_12210 [Ancylobacter novellus]